MGFLPSKPFNVIVLVAGVGCTTHHVPTFLQRRPDNLLPAWPRPGGMTVKGGGPPIDWAALAPLIEHETRESIVEALRWVGPLSTPELKRVIDDPEFQLAYIHYHLTTLVREEVLVEFSARPAGGSVEKVYFFAAPA